MTPVIDKPIVVAVAGDLNTSHRPRVMGNKSPPINYHVGLGNGCKALVDLKHSTLLIGLSSKNVTHITN